MKQSRVFRQRATVEAVWLVEPGVEPPNLDLDSILREAVMSNAETPRGAWMVAGDIELSEREELTP